MATKRRLLYLPDDEALLNELTDSPHPRPSRLSRLLISPSSDDLDNANRSATDNPQSSSKRIIDEALLVSYGGYIMADGSGNLRSPKTHVEAMELYKALRRCCLFLHEFVHDDSISQDSLDSLSSGEDKKEVDSSDASDSSRPRRRQKAQPRQFLANHVLLEGTSSIYGNMTVLELREKLRGRNLPISGTKAILCSRLEKDDRLFTNHESSRESSVTQNETISKDGSFFSTISENGDGNRTVWGTLLDMGSRLFRRSTGSLTDSLEPPQKRRRSS